MNNPVWLIRVMIRTNSGWGTEFGEYGSPFSNKEAAIGLADKLRAEGKYAQVQVYECSIVY